MSTHSTPAKGSPNGNSILIQRFLDRLSLYVGADEAESWRSDPRFHYVCSSPCPGAGLSQHAMSGGLHRATPGA